MTRIEMFVETSVYSSISHITPLLAQEYFIEFSHRENFKLIISREDVNKRLQKLSKYHKLYGIGVRYLTDFKNLFPQTVQTGSETRPHALLSNRYRRLSSRR